MMWGGTPRLAKLTKRASGFRSNCLTAFSLARISAPAPSLVCELLPAVTEPLRGEHRPQLGEAFDRGVGARPFVERDGAGAVAGLAAREVGKALDDFDRRHLVGELAALLRLQRLQVRLQRELVLRLAR